MDTSISEFIKRYSCSQEEASHSFSTLHGVGNSFGVSADSIPDFIEEYCIMANKINTVNSKAGSKKATGLNLGEQIIKKHLPLVVNHLFQFKLEKGDKGEDGLISESFILALVYSYQSTISEMFNVDHDLNELVTVVLKSDIWFLKGKDNIACCFVELRFPYCIIDKNMRKNKFIPAAITKLRNNNVISGLDTEPTEKWDGIIQDSEISQNDGNFLPMYMSVTNKTYPPSRFEGVFHGLQSVKDDSKEADLDQVFDPHDHSYFKSGDISAQCLERHSDPEFWLPLFLSSSFCTKVTPLKDTSKEEKKQITNSSNHKPIYEIDEDNNDPLALAAIFLDIIPPEILLEDNAWLDVGRAIYNITEGSDEGLEFFIEVSSKCLALKNDIDEDEPDEKEEKKRLPPRRGEKKTKEVCGRGRNSEDEKERKEVCGRGRRNGEDEKERKELRRNTDNYEDEKERERKEPRRKRKGSVSSIRSESDYGSETDGSAYDRHGIFDRDEEEEIEPRRNMRRARNDEYKDNKEQKEEEEKHNEEKKEEKTPRDVKTCKYMWENKLDGTPITIKTLGWLARYHDRESYDKWHTEWVGSAVGQALIEMTDLDIAEAIYRYFWLEFIVSSMKGTGEWWWYADKAHRFVPSDCAFNLRDGITKRILPFLEKMRNRVTSEQLNVSNSNNNRGKKKELEEKINQIGVLIKKLKSGSGRNKVIDMCKEKFYIENFRKLTDKGGMKSAWPNCVTEVIEIKGKKKIVVREGKPEDYLTKQGMVRYRRDFHPDHPTVKQFLEYLRQVFVDEEIRHYFEKDISSYMIGINLEKIFRIWTGVKGDNSKTMMTKIMQAWWGDKCIDLPLSAYSAPKGGSRSGPSPEIAQIDGCQMAITAEPNEGEDLGAGAIKRATGRDRTFARFCNENGGSIELAHKSIYMCNFVPNIPGVDEPTKKRCVFLLFLSKWVMEPPETEEERYQKRLFQMDLNFDQKIPRLAEAMFWFAVHNFDTYVKEGLKIPKKMKEHADEHWKVHDPHEAFMDERLKKIDVEVGEEPTSSNSITAGELFPQFRSFFRSRYPQSIIPTHPQFEAQMTQRLGERVKRRWLGWSLLEAV
jgi:hypothetical protein